MCSFICYFFYLINLIFYFLRFNILIYICLSVFQVLFISVIKKFL